MKSEISNPHPSSGKRSYRICDTHHNVDDCRYDHGDCVIRGSWGPRKASGCPILNDDSLVGYLNIVARGQELSGRLPEK
jgi:cytochrome c5